MMEQIQIKVRLTGVPHPDGGCYAYLKALDHDDDMLFVWHWDPAINHLYPGEIKCAKCDYTLKIK